MGIKPGTEIKSRNNGDLNKKDEAIHENEELFRVLADTSLTAIFLVQNNRFVYANPAAEQILGYSKEELLKKNFWEIIHPDDREPIMSYGFSLLKGELTSGRYEVRFLKRNGDIGWCIITVAPATYNGEMAGVVSGFDITERKRAEETLQESEEKFRVLSEMSPAAIFLYQGDKLVYVNQAAQDFTGYGRDALLNKNFWDMIHPAFQNMVKGYGMARQAGDNVPTQYEIQYITSKGEVRWAEFYAGLIKYRGKPAVIVIAIDITDRKHYEAALEDSRTQAELYVDLMGHDINNLNQVALGYLELATERLKLDSQSGELIAKPVEALEKSSLLIQKVKKLQLMRSGSLKTMAMDIGKTLEDVIHIYANAPDRDVRINYTPVDGRVMADELLVDIFSNLVVNAIKHSPCDRPLIIDITSSTTRKDERDYVKILIDDNGPGIPDDKKENVFGRFASGSNVTRGSGLGLYLVKSLVESYGGNVWVENRVPGDHTKGSRFVVMLPSA
jgi:PAS domain S-box-containing protein